jgi:hypothetical protein
MWLLSFHDGAAEAFSTAKVLPQLVEVVKNTAKEKVEKSSNALSFCMLHGREIYKYIKES